MISGKKRRRLLTQGRTLLISDLLCGLSSLLVAAQSADALHHQIDGQNHQQDADDTADVAPHHTVAAGHDAGDIAQEGIPMAMIFIANQNGSHNHREAMRMEDFLSGVQILTRTLKDL